MDPPDLLGAGEVGDGPRDPQHAVEAARRLAASPPPRRRAACGPARRASRRGRAVRRRPRHWSARPRHCSAPTGPRAPRRPAGRLRRCPRPAAASVRSAARHPWHFDMKVDPVEQRARHLGLIIGGAARRPAARQRGIAEMAAAARVHRRDQLDPRREGDMRVGAGDADAAGLERLAQRIEHRRAGTRAARRGTARRDARG